MKQILFLIPLLFLSGCCMDLQELACSCDNVTAEVNSENNEEVLSMYEYRARLIRVVDGDTMDVDIDLGFGIHFQERIRLAGINTPETYGVKKDSEEYQLGKQAALFVEDKLEGKEFIIRTEKDSKGKYGRYIAIIIVDDVNLNDELVEQKLAEKVEY